MQLTDIMIGLLLYGILPAWLGAGFADYLSHRSTDIAHTSGRAEAALHVTQYLQLAVAIALGLFFEITTLALVLMAVLVLAHSLTAVWDVSFTERRRYIAPIEQHIHSYMETLPIFALCIVALLSWSELAPLFGRGAGSWTLRLKSSPLPAWSIAVVLGGIALSGLAIAEEYWRSSRAKEGKHAAKDDRGAAR